MSEKKISGDENGSGKFIFTGMKINVKTFSLFHIMNLIIFTDMKIKV